MSFERELKDRMRRPEPPAGFADRVMQRVASERKGRGSAPVSPARRWVVRSIAAALFLTVGIGVVGYRAEQRRRGAEAAEQALVALRITSEKMNVAKQTLQSRGGSDRGGGKS